MPRRLLLITVIIVSVIVPACNGTNTQIPVKVAISLPLRLEISQQMLRGIQLAHEEARQESGGVPVELLILDTSSEQDPLSSRLEQEATDQAIADQAVVAYLTGAWTDQIRGIMPRLNETGMVQISLYATWPGLTKSGFRSGEPNIYYPSGQRHFFRLVPSDDVQVRAATKWAQQLGFNTVYIMGDSSTYGRGIAELFRVTASEFGIQVVAYREGFDSQTIAADALIDIARQIDATDADLFYYGSTLGFELIQAIRTVDPGQPIMVPDGLVQSELVTSPESYLDGIFGTTVVAPVDQLQAAETFVASYQAAYEQSPDPFAATGYEAMQVILQAIDRSAKLTRQEVLTEVKEQGEFSGLLGRWHFDQAGDISQTAISGLQIQNGQWTFVQLIE